MDGVTVLVATRYGKVAGQVVDGIARFLGVPYAAPPLGRNRFGPPVPPVPWTGVREARAFGPTPLKPAVPGPLGELMPDPVIAGEEWLSLNVWTPDPGRAGLPVMVWIHGGAFVAGSSAVPAFDGAAFARHGVVCVTVNYRLGVDGFAYLPDAPAPANRGLRDQIAALEWVRENIAHFGGDPGNVTAFGQSAGAIGVLALLSLDLGLFRRAIAQSGTAHVAHAAGDAARVTHALEERLGLPPTAAALAAVPLDHLAEAQADVGAAVGANPGAYGQSIADSAGMAFAPVVDDDLLGRRPIDAIAAGAGRDVPLLAGNTTEEWRLFVMATPVLHLPGEEPFRNMVAGCGAPDGCYDAYARIGSAAYPRRSPADIACAVLGDRVFRIPTWRVAEARADAPAPTHVYEFGWRSPVAPQAPDAPLGACHGLEIPFVWGDPGAPANRPLTGEDPPRELATAMHRAWTGFAATGALPWPRYDGSRPVMAYSHDNRPVDAVVHDPHGDDRRLWQGHLMPR